MNTEAWRAAFDDRHEFDVYPDHFMSGLRNEFCAGWHAALKSQAANQSKPLTREQIKAIEAGVGLLYGLGKQPEAFALRSLLPPLSITESAK